MLLCNTYEGLEKTYISEQIEFKPTLIFYPFILYPVISHISSFNTMLIFFMFSQIEADVTLVIEGCISMYARKLILVKHAIFLSQCKKNVKQ